MNMFFYNLGRGTAKTQHSVAVASCGACKAVREAGASYVQGYQAQRAEYRATEPVVLRTVAA